MDNYLDEKMADLYDDVVHIMRRGRVFQLGIDTELELYQLCMAMHNAVGDLSALVEQNLKVAHNYRRRLISADDMLARREVINPSIFMEHLNDLLAIINKMGAVIRQSPRTDLNCRKWDSLWDTCNMIKATLKIASGALDGILKAKNVCDVTEKINVTLGLEDRPSFVANITPSYFFGYYGLFLTSVHDFVQCFDK